MRFNLSGRMEDSWGWLVTFGAISMLLGVIALFAVGLTTIFSVMYLGVTIFILGVAQIIHGLSVRKDGHLWLNLSLGALGIVLGYIIFAFPVKNAIILTLFLASYFLVSGIVVAIGSLVERGQGWAWSLISGLLSFVVGFVIFKQPLESSIWLIGALVGIDLIFRGSLLMQLGLAVKSGRILKSATV